MPCEAGCSPTIEEIQSIAAQLGQALAWLQIDPCDADELDRLLASVRGAQSALDAAIIRIGSRADELAADGCGAPARDTLLGNGRVRGSTARREAARAVLAGRSPLLRQVMGSGHLGSDHLDALVRRLRPLDDEHLDRVVASGLLDRASTLPADTFDAALTRAVEAAARDDRRPDEPAEAIGQVRHWFDHRTGVGHLTARLDPERYEALATALDQHAASLANDRGDHTAKNASLTAEALIDLVCGSGARRAHLPHVTVVVDRATLNSGRHDTTIAETSNGHDLSDQALARLCCDAVLQRVTLGEDGVPINVGRRYRTATDAQWAALRAVHRSCAWLGCDRPLSHCQAHHIRYWGNGGPTNLDNLVPLCSHHHHLVHEGQWSIELRPGRSMVMTRPDGRTHGRTSPPTRRPPDPPPLAGHRILTTEQTGRLSVS